jgi:methylglutaconyl-CoA hydratase
MNIQQAVTSKIDERGVATVTLNNPDKHNAFDDVIIAELQSAFLAIDENDDARIMVLAAAGRSFSAGGDLNWMKRMASYGYDENLQDARALANMLRTLNSLSKPTIARVQGAAFGGAVGLVSCCDIAVGSKRASFSLSEVRIGLVPATIAPYVIAAIGARAARRYFLTAERFSAQQALELGLLSSLVEEDQLDQQVESFIAALLDNSPVALGIAKQLIPAVVNQPIDESLIEKTSEIIASIRVSPEGQEGLSAFLEKRPAVYQPKNK